MSCLPEPLCGEVAVVELVIKLMTDYNCTEPFIKHVNSPPNRIRCPTALKDEAPIPRTIPTSKFDAE